MTDLIFTLAANEAGLFASTWEKLGLASIIIAFLGYLGMRGKNKADAAAIINERAMAMLDKKDEDLQETRGDLKETRGGLKETRDKLEGVIISVGELTGKVVRMEHMQRELHDAQAKVVRLEEQVKTAEARIQELERKVGDRDEQLLVAHRERDAAMESLKNSRRNVEDLRAQLASEQSARERAEHLAGLYESERTALHVSQHAAEETVRKVRSELEHHEALADDADA